MGSGMVVPYLPSCEDEHRHGSRIGVEEVSLIRHLVHRDL